MKAKRLMMTTALLLALLTAAAQGSPAHFSVSRKQVSPTEIDLIFSGTIDKGWHVYSTDLGADGPIAATLHTEKADGAEPVGKLKAQGKEIQVFDPLFAMQLRYFENSVAFVQRYRLTAPQYQLKGYLEYGACSDQMCMPPTQVDFSFSGNGPATATPAAPSPAETPQTAEAPADGQQAQTAGETPETDSIATDTATVIGRTDLWQPVITELRSLETDPKAATGSLWYVFLAGLLGGLAALFTPCVWPIIPMTVSFFLKRNKNKAKGIRDAVTYGLSIIVIYMALALLVTALFGPQRLNDLATKIPFNLFFTFLLVVFALSFFGWFELALPSSWADKVDSKASRTSGLLSIFLMAFTLALVSFSCTGPIVGFLLVDFATSGNWTAPAIGMFGFALALALPFTLFALFPSWLKQAPKSGSWMNTIKVVLAFIELAFACKFFSVADLVGGWHLMDREVFLSIWIALFGTLSLYLLGLLRFPSDGEEGRKPKPVPCILLGMVSLTFTVYMIPGLWGAPCKAVSAFAPPMYTQDFNLNPRQVEAAYTDYEQGMAAATAQGKPVLLDFSGFGCVNCRKMEASVWPEPVVADRLTKDYVLITLYVDDKTPLSKPMEVTAADGTRRTLRTVGDKWSWLEQSKFGFLAQPFYVTLDNQGRPLSGSFAYKEDATAFLDFLDRGLKRFRNNQQQAE